MNKLIRLFVPDSDNVQDPAVRARCGRFTSLVGILLNALLAAGKFFAGTLVGSVAITADAANNLSDAGSSVISLIGFKLAEKPADEDHPFGHARIEYIASLAVAFLVLMLGLQLGRESLTQVFHPEEVSFSWLSVFVLCASILIKLFLYGMNRSIGKKLDSLVMQATAADSLSDGLATGAVLLSTLISPLIHFSLDGYMGLAVAFLILRSAVGILRETLNKLLGEAPTEETEQLLRRHILSREGVLSVHDLVVHSYGPGRTFATAHVEVDAKEDILKSHDRIDNIEREVLEDHGINLVIHLDPVVTDDPETNWLREQTEEAVQRVDPSLTMHDFRMVKGETHSNLIFDVVVPHGCKKSDPQLGKEIEAEIRKIRPNLYAVVTFDRMYSRHIEEEK